MYWNNVANNFGGYAVQSSIAVFLFFDCLEDAKYVEELFNGDYRIERCGLQITIYE